MNDRSEKTLWILILGYGRSGSTWLELSIAQKTQALCLGEFFLLKDPNSQCSCQQSVESCSQWSSFIHIDEVERIERLLSHQVITDSSKSARGSKQHLKALGAHTNIDIQPIICFRHPIRILRSARKGNNRLLRKNIQTENSYHWLRFIFTWPLAYINSFYFCFKARTKPIIVNFDNECSVSNVLKQYSDTKNKSNNPELFKHIIEGNRLIDSGVKPWKKPDKLTSISLKEHSIYIALWPLYKTLCLLEKKHRG